MADPGLETLQRWMARVVRHRADSDTAVRSDPCRELIPFGRVLDGEVVLPSPTMTPTERLDVYNGAYFTRLVECIEEDFPGVRYALGDHRTFRELLSGYFDAHPSRHQNLVFLADRLPAYLATRELEHRDFVVELATLELAMSRAFHAPEFTPLDAAELAGVEPDDWAGAVLYPNPSLQLFAFDYPIGRFLQQVFDEEQPSIPEPSRSWLAVYRNDERVWRVKLSPGAHAVLAALVAGTPFGAALARAGDEAHLVGEWFQDWSADGVFERIDFPK